MRWNIPQFPADLPLKKYHFARWIGLICILSLSSLLALVVLKEYLVTNNMFEDIKDILPILLGLLVTIFLISVFLTQSINESISEHNEENIKLKQQWEVWGKRPITLIGFSSSLPKQYIERISSPDNPISYLEKPISTNENQPYELTEDIIKYLLSELSDMLIHSVANQNISVSIISPKIEFTEDDLYRVWRELALPMNQLGSVNIAQQDMSTLFKTFYQQTSAQFSLILIIDQYSSTQKIGAAWLTHNAVHLLDKRVPIIANLPRLMTCDMQDLATDIQNLNRFQKLEYPILSTLFSDLKQAEKTQVIQNFYQSGYLSSNMSLAQVDMNKILGETIKLRDWFSFTTGLISLQSVSKEGTCLNIVVKQDDALLVGNIIGLKPN